MQEDELNALIDKTATLMAQYERRGERIDARLQALGRALQDLAGRVPEVVRDSADEALRSVSSRAADSVRAGLEAPLQDYRERLRRAGADIGGAAQVLAGQVDQIRRLHRAVVWKLFGAAVLALALLTGGGAWLSLHYARVIRDHQRAAELLQAYDRADVVLCGGGELCANVDAKRARYGDRGQYLPVKRR